MNAIKFYNLARYMYNRKIPFLPKLMKGIIFLLFNSIIPYECEIGKKSMCGYGGIGVVIHKNSIIGENVMIGTQVTIGGKSNNPKVPVIGNNVYIGTGSKILGDVTIGDNVIIGANSVVLKSVPSNCIVAGRPAKVIRENIDIFEYCNLPKIKSEVYK